MVKGDIFYSRLVFSTPDLKDGKEAGPHYWLLIKTRTDKKRDGTGKKVHYFVPLNTKDAFHIKKLQYESSVDFREKTLITIKGRMGKQDPFPPFNTVVQSKIIAAIKEQDIQAYPTKILYLDGVNLQNQEVDKISQSVNYWMAKARSEQKKYLVDIIEYEANDIAELKDVRRSKTKLVV